MYQKANNEVKIMPFIEEKIKTINNAKPKKNDALEPIVINDKIKVCILKINYLHNMLFFFFLLYALFYLFLELALEVKTTL